MTVGPGSYAAMMYALVNQGDGAGGTGGAGHQTYGAGGAGGTGYEDDTIDFGDVNNRIENPDGIIDFGDDSDLASKDPDEVLSLGESGALSSDILEAGLPYNLLVEVSNFLNGATYGRAIDFLEKLDAYDGSSDDILDKSDGLSSLTKGELEGMINDITGETEETDT